MKSTRDLIVDIISEQLGIMANTIYLDSTAASLDMDSLDTVELVMAIDEEFDLAIPDEDCEAWTTVQSIIDYVEKSV